MHEHIARVVYYFGVHLLFASMVWLAAWALTSMSRGSATTKYWIWMTTSLNFVLPVGAVLDKSFASHLSWAVPLGMVGPVGVWVADHAGVIGSVWSAGAILMFARLFLRLQAERNARQTEDRDAPDPTPSLLVHGIAVRFTDSGQGPAVKGVLRPHICLPAGMWMTGSRLALYRELSCDEAVIQRAQGKDLVTALAKLANPESAPLLQATASSFMSHRLSRLIAAAPRRRCVAAN
jgi:hypothetical protein